MNDSNFGRKEKTILLILSCLFIALFLLLSFYNRFSADDYFTIHLLKNKSILEYAIYIYQTWNIRLAPLLLASAVIKLSYIPHILFVFGAITLIAILLSIFFLFNNLFTIYLNKKPNKIILFFYSTLACSLFFFTTFRIDETWFWLSSSVTYLWATIALIAGSALLLSNSKNITTLFLLIICFAYVGTSSEPFALLLITVLILFAILHLSKNNWFQKLIKNKHFYLKLYIALFICAFAFLFTCLAPGQSLRASLFEEPDFLKSIIITAKAIIKIIINFSMLKIVHIVLLGVSFVYLGYKSNANEENRIDFISLKKSFLISILILVFFILLSIFPMAYIMQDIALNRTLTHLSFIITIFSLYWFYIIGYKTKINFLSLKKIFYVSSIASIFIFSILLIYQYRTVSNYSRALDNRIKNLKTLNLKAETKVVELEPLSSSGFLHSAEISTDTAYEQNIHLQNGLFLKFPVRLKK